MSHHSHQYLDENSQTKEYQDRFRYKDALRPSDSSQDVTVAQLGHMLDTLKDAALCMRHLAVDPHLDPQYDRVYLHTDQKDLPPYVEALASNFMRGSSFNRNDLRDMEKKHYPDISAFMNIVHGMMRQQSLKIAEAFVMPQEVAETGQEYDALIKEYKTLVEKYSKPDEKPDYRNIPADEMQHYAERFEPVADKLAAQLKALPSIDVEIGGKRHTIPNDTLVNGRLTDTYPAAVWFAYRTLGSGAADKNKRPADLEYEARQRKLIGAQSMITDTVQGLLDIGDAQGFEWPGALDRTKLQKAMEDYTHSFNLLLHFCRTADCIYPLVGEDLERFIHMGGGSPELGDLQNPYETALMLYAVERRIAREDKDPALGRKMKAYADAIAQCSDNAAMQEKFGKDVEFQRTLMRVRKIVGEEMQTALPGLEAVMKAIGPSLGRVNDRAGDAQGLNA